MPDSIRHGGSVLVGSIVVSPEAGTLDSVNFRA